VSLGEGTVLQLDDNTRERLASLLDWASAVVLGPGMGVDDGRVDFLEFVLSNARCPLVLDADALNCLAIKRELLKKVSVPVVVTPHPGEMARLAGQSIDEIQADRIKAAAAFSKEWGTITVLKGANSVIAEANGNIYINTTGNPGMASGGMGDVLAGMTASFIAQGFEPAKAACVAVYIHGRAADLLAGERGMYGLTASELAEYIPPAVKLTTEG
jgi:NAD(P)H-hydrate epimerase